ncbi:DNA internalization-related competence protein ComEC/Rec2 [Miniphocaeibacter halophilus]|uniref:DNA internalization-related competence protein ComEC/Rec2 n=1 Tax=Miniphocaeibacter halophilus TaxID=2931922 RepID=A0AC61MTR0_9FIRM|nr:DNA internalization-related competence protein ComEC/Rec2 [Miniphocaeibacter halophilus]QQK07653.1 DNA internalization-related competence protein ComEC/Rec2 [Miniphocaeibacter halophilus]
MRKYPSVIIAIILFIGIILNKIFNFPKNHLIIFLFLGTFLFLIKNKNINYLGLALILTTVTIFNFNNTLNKINPTLDGNYYTVSGDIKNLKKDDNKTTLIITNVALDSNIKIEDIIVYYNGENNKLSVGDKIKFIDQIYVPIENFNPGEFNYYNYLISNNIFYYSYTKDLQVIGRSSNILLTARDCFFTKVNKILSKLDSNSKDFLYSVFTGNNFLSEEYTNMYKNLGIMHILSVSGLHIVILQSLLMFCLNFIIINKNTKRILSLFLIFLYCLLIGFPISAIRAFIFLFIDFISSVSMRPKVQIKTISISAILILLINPWSIFDLGFQFSFLSVLGIAIIYPLLKNKNYANGSILNLFYITLAINILIIPLQLYYFKNFSIAFFLGNIIAIPILTIIINISVIYMLVNFLPLISTILKLIIDFLYNISTYCLLGINNLFEKFNNGIYLNLYNIISIYMIIVLILIMYKNYYYLKRNSKIILNILIKLIPIHIILLFYCTNFLTPLRFNMINIGQGDCFLLETKNYNILFDTGGSVFKEYDKSGNRLINFLKYKKIKNIDAIFISHFDEDHAGNIKLLLDNFGEIPVYGRNNGLDILKNKYEIDNVLYFELNNNEIIKFEDIEIQVISPNNQVGDENSKSLIFKMKINNNTILLTGDTIEEVEKNILDNNLKSDILKIPHHGSKTSSSTEFINTVNPRIALLSVGKNNIYNLPNDEVIKKYKENNVNIKRTDNDGIIITDFYKDGYKIYKYSEILKYNISNSVILIYTIYGLALVLILKNYYSRMTYEKKYILNLW